jgi:hypothetical protein
VTDHPSCFPEASQIGVRRRVRHGLSMLSVLLRDRRDNKGLVRPRMFVAIGAR